MQAGSSSWRFCRSAALVTVLVVPFVMIMWISSCSRRAELQISEAKQFCEALMPAIERAKTKDNSYPQFADPTWWKGLKVPSLIDLDYVYDAWNWETGGPRTSYYLRFGRPNSVGTRYLVYSSITQSWSENDTDVRRSGWVRTYTTSR